MSVLSEKTFDALAIRDTSSHTGDIVFNGEYTIKTIIVENELNQAVTLQCQASMHSDFANMFTVGSSFDVAASTNDYQSCDTYFPYWRMIATCDSSPTTGDLTAHVLGT